MSPTPSAREGIILGYSISTGRELKPPAAVTSQPLRAAAVQARTRSSRPRRTSRASLASASMDARSGGGSSAGKSAGMTGVVGSSGAGGGQVRQQRHPRPDRAPGSWPARRWRADARRVPPGRESSGLAAARRPGATPWRRGCVRRRRAARASLPMPRGSLGAAMAAAPSSARIACLTSPASQPRSGADFDNDQQRRGGIDVGARRPGRHRRSTTPEERRARARFACCFVAPGWGFVQWPR